MDVRERCGDGLAGVAHGHGEQARTLGDDGREMSQQGQRVVVRELEVVDDDQCRLARGGVQRSLYRAEHACAAVLLVRRGRRLAGLGQIGDQQRDVAGEWSELFDHRRARRDELPEQFAERLVRQADVGDAGTPQDERAVAPSGPGELTGQPGLADAGLTRDHHGACFALADGRPVDVETRELAVTTDERQGLRPARCPG